MIGTMGRLGLTLALVLSVVLVAVGDPRAASGTASTRVFLPLLPKGGSGPTPTPTHVLPTPTPGTQPTPLPTVVGGPNYSFLNPPNPVNLSSVTADPSRAVSLSLPASGGSLTATAADGTTFNLTIPANALVQPTTITMTPILSVGGLPGTLRLVDGVQLAPDGLRLYQLATLTITPASTVTTPYTFATGSNGQETYGYPSKLGTNPFTLALIHFSVYLLGEGSYPILDQSTPTFTEDQFQNIARQIMADPNAPEFESRLTQLNVLYWNQIIAPALETIQGGCDPLQQLTPTIYGWDRQAQLFFGANNNPFQTEFDAINQKVTTAMVNCWNQTIAPCVDWTNQTQAQKVMGMVRQAAVLGLENQINLEQITPCGCTNVTQLTKGWQGTMNFNFAGQGSHTYPNGPTTTSASIQTSFSVTSPLAHALTEGAFFYPYETDPNVMAWDTGPSNPSGTASMNDQTEQKDPSNDVTDTNIGSGPPVTDRVGNLSYVRVVFSPKTCLYALTVGINVVATQTVLPGGQPFTAPQNLVMLYLPDFSLPPPNQGTTISGSSSVLVYALNNAGGPHDPYVIPDGSEIGVLGQVSGDNGQPNLGSATVNWSFTPIP